MLEQENNFKPTWLYIKHHSITGLKYFGCTTKYRARNYDGSGLYWSNHIRKHNRKYVVTDLLVGPYTNKDELKNLALWMSEEMDIVNSDEWANKVLEDGMAISGRWRSKGWNHSMESCQKISESLKGHSNNKGQIPWNKGKSTSDETKLKQSLVTRKKHSDEQNKAKSQRQLGKKHKPHKPHKPCNYKTVVCPHCGKTGRGSNMTRYHFDKCKQKGNT